VDIVVKGRHTEVPERFRRHAVEKLARVEKHDHKLIRIDVELSKEHNPRLAEQSERIELTVRSKGR
jgi:ribosomal subunit interface protein